MLYHKAIFIALAIAFLSLSLQATQTSLDSLHLLARLNAYDFTGGNRSLFSTASLVTLKQADRLSRLRSFLIESNAVLKFNQNNTIVTEDFLTGRFSSKDAKEMLLIKSGAGIQRPMVFRKEVWESFKKMHAHAQREGVSLKVVSAFRSYHYQNKIWQRKWNALTTKGGVDLTREQKNTVVRKIMRYSAIPGLSRHHWGTEIDLNSLKNGYFQNTIEGKKVHRWLSENAEKYGFIRVYDGRRNGGFQTELWHYSYYPTAVWLTALYATSIKPESLSGFLGSDAVNLELIYEEYFFQLNPQYIKLSKDLGLWPR